MTVKYPLPCGCAGPKYISMCDAHQLAAREDHQRQLGASEEIRVLRLEVARLNGEIRRLKGE